MVCKGCYRDPAVYHVTWHSPDGWTTSAERCARCYSRLLKGLPSYPETYPDMIVTLIFLLLDFSLTCIATFLWIDPKSLSPGLIIVPLVSGALAGTLIGFQM